MSLAYHQIACVAKRLLTSWAQSGTIMY